MFERVKDIKLSVIKQVELEASRYPDMISLAQGVPSFDTPECIKRRVELALKRGVTARYSLSPGLPELRELIEVNLARDGMYYDWQTEILVTVGTIEAITSTILAITNPGDEIIVPEPAYTSYREVIRLAGCKEVFAPLDESKGWALDFDKLEGLITDKTRAIFFCNPNNPTGTIYSREQLMRLGEMAEAHDIFLISDEVYKEFVYDSKDRIFSLAEIPRWRDRVIRLYGFSKAYALTGWRIGYLHSGAKIVKEVIKVHDSLVTCAPVVSQYAAMGALEMGDKDMRYFNEQYRIRRDLICGRLDRMPEVFSYVHPRSTYYVFPKVNDKFLDSKENEYLSTSWDLGLKLIRDAQVAAVPGFAFGRSGEGHLRFNFGKTEKEIIGAFDRLEKYFSK